MIMLLQDIGTIHPEVEINLANEVEPEDPQL